MDASAFEAVRLGPGGHGETLTGRLSSVSHTHTHTHTYTHTYTYRNTHTLRMMDH